MKQNKPKLLVDFCSHEAAKYACEHWHYSKTLPVPPLFKLGVWEDDKFIGAVIFSRGASPDLLKPYNLNQTEGCELTRVALSKHKTEVSRVLSIAIKILKKINEKLKLVVSFADSSKNHHGGIYQAMGWIYTGKSNDSIEYWKDGKRWHPRQLSSKGFTTQFGMKRKTPKPGECKKIKVAGKFRYLFPLDSEIRKTILKLSEIYPKRIKHEINVPEFHSGEGGVVPTDALHLDNELKNKNISNEE